MAERVSEQHFVPIDYPGGSREAAMAESVFDVSLMDPHLDFCDAVTLRHQLMQSAPLCINNPDVPDIIMDDKKAMVHAAIVRALDARRSTVTQTENSPGLVRRISRMLKPEQLYATAYIKAVEFPRFLRLFY